MIDFELPGGPLRYQIERLTFGGILDQSFRLMRDHFLTLTAGFAALYIPLSALTGMFPTLKPGATGPDAALAVVWFGLLYVLLAFLCMPFVQLLVTTTITDIYLGQTIDLRSAARRARSSYLAYLGTTLLVGIVMVGGMFLCLLPGLYFAVCCALVGPLAVVENVYGRTSISRSRTLVKGFFWRAAGLFVVISILGVAIGAVAQAGFEFIPFLGGALTGVVQAITATFGSVVVVVLYVDLRCRHEDFDIRLLAAQVASADGRRTATRVSGGMNAPLA